MATFLSGCKGSDKKTKLVGKVNYNGKGLSSATIEIYLKSEKDKSVPPFMTGETNESGDFEITLPAGKYFIIGKKRFFEGGVTNMLMGEYPKNPIVADSGKTVTVAPFSLFNMGADKRLDIEGSGLTGKVTSDGVDIVGSFVYVYPESNPSMIGPSYIVSQEINADGTFKVNLLAGRYYVGVRQRSSKTKLGYLNQGDLSVDYEKNPVTVKQDEYFDLGALKLHQVDSEKLAKIKEESPEQAYSTKISGRVTNEDSEPVYGIYVYAYNDPKMVGKPTALSKKTDKEGRFTLYVTNNEKSNNIYYVGARTNFGGPLEPGEYVGTYNENPQHQLIIDKKQEITGIDIIVKEVW